MTGTFILAVVLGVLFFGGMGALLIFSNTAPKKKSGEESPQKQGR
jgi:hypothetical protein